MHVNAFLDQNGVVLTASRRLAHALRVGYARHAQKQGRSAWRTPRVLPWSAWLRQQRLELRAEGRRDALERVLTRAESRVLWDAIVSASRSGRDLLNPGEAARLAATSWRLLHEYEIPPEELRAFEAPEAQALYGWGLEFIERSRALNAIDEGQLLGWAAAADIVPSEKVAFVGFDVTPPAMARLIERWRRRGLIVELKPAAHRGREAVAVSAADARAELELAARWARSQVEAGASDVGVIVGDLQARRDEVRRVFEDVFAPGVRRSESGAASIPIVIAAPPPLSGYPLVDAALTVLELASGERPSTTVGRLLRSPFIAGGESERERRALADLRLREQQLDRWDWQELERWAAVTQCERLELAARDLNALLRTGFPSAPASVWAERFHAMLRRMGWPGERSLSSVEHQTAAKFNEALAEFGALDAVVGRMSLQQARSRLRDVLTDTPFEPETVNAAVTVIDASTSAGMSFDALWVIGLHAERWPGPATPDPLIPLALQRAASVPSATAQTVLQQATAQLQRWMTSAKSVVFSWPEREGEAELSASPLLQRLQTAHAALLAQDVTPTLRELIFAQRPVLESFVDERAPPLPREQARGGARTVELQSVCPFRAQAEVRLGAEPLPRVSLGVEPVDRGALLHRVLFELWGKFKTQQELLSIDEAALRATVEATAARHAMQTLRPATRSRSRLAALEVESVVRQILRLLDLERSRPPFNVRFAESAEQFTLGGLTITLRPDRIDELADGRELLIDYKLGDAHKPRDWLDLWPGRPRQPQLPLYALAHVDRLSALAFVVLAPGAVEYRGWSNGAPVGAGVAPYPSGVRVDLGDPLDWEALMHHWRYTLTRLAERYVEGEASVDPLPQACITCSLSTLCRIHERDAQAEDANGVD